MKAGVSSPNGLELRDIPQPEPKPNEVLTRVKACGLNRADLSAAKASFGHGVMGAPLGLEWAGEVAAVGSEVKDFKPGDRVVASGSAATPNTPCPIMAARSRCPRASRLSRRRCCLSRCIRCTTR